MWVERGQVGGPHLFVPRPHHFVTQCNHYCRSGKLKVTRAPGTRESNSKREAELVSVSKCEEKKSKRGD